MMEISKGICMAYSAYFDFLSSFVLNFPLWYGMNNRELGSHVGVELLLALGNCTPASIKQTFLSRTISRVNNSTKHSKVSCGSWCDRWPMKILVLCPSTNTCSEVIRGELRWGSFDTSEPAVYSEGSETSLWGGICFKIWLKRYIL